MQEVALPHARPHLGLHELTDSIANQFLLVSKRKIHRVVGRFAAAFNTARRVRTMLTRNEKTR